MSDKETTIINIVLLTGLPGCGKTIYRKKVYENPVTITETDDMRSGQFAYADKIIIELEQFLNESKEIDYKQIVEYILNGNIFGITNTIVVDGFLPTVDARKKLVNFLINTVQEMFYGKYKIYVQEVYWKPDKMVSYYNDAGRRFRDTPSDELIFNSKLERPLDVSDIEYSSVCLIAPEYQETKSYISPDYVLEAVLIHNRRKKDVFDKKADEYIVSDYGAKEFKELDYILECICPNMSYFTYKRIYRMCDIVKERPKTFILNDKGEVIKRFVVNVAKLKEVLKMILHIEFEH